MLGSTSISPSAVLLFVFLPLLHSSDGNESSGDHEKEKYREPDSWINYKRFIDDAISHDSHSFKRVIDDAIPPDVIYSFIHSQGSSTMLLVTPTSLVAAPKGTKALLATSTSLTMISSPGKMESPTKSFREDSINDLKRELCTTRSSITSMSDRFYHRSGSVEFRRGERRGGGGG